METYLPLIWATLIGVAVAASVALCDRKHRPVVVMVPPSLKEKWPRDYALFKEKCLPEPLAERLRCGRAERAVEFLKLLDDPPERRKSILFVTHGAMGRGLNDPWVMLALISRALYRRTGADKQRRRLSRVLGRLLPPTAQPVRHRQRRASVAPEKQSRRRHARGSGAPGHRL